MYDDRAHHDHPGANDHDARTQHHYARLTVMFARVYTVTRVENQNLVVSTWKWEKTKVVYTFIHFKRKEKMRKKYFRMFKMPVFCARLGGYNTVLTFYPVYVYI